MGTYLAILKNKNIKVDKQLLNLSGAKLREFYCSYRSICESFSISIPEFIQIFGFNVKSYNVWDNNDSGFINSMEMFAGLIVYSKVSFEEKVNFLFELFDLNEEEKLGYEALAFMFLCICEATAKIYQLEENVFSQQDVQEYLSDFFSQESEITSQQFIRWSYRVEEIIEFFKIIGHEFTPFANTHTIDQYDETNILSKRRKYFNYKTERVGKVLIEDRFLNLIRNDHILQQISEGDQFNPDLNWVYGIRIDDIRQPIHYSRTKIDRAANQKLLYINGKIVIVFYPNLNLQRNYTRHQQPISVFEMSPCQQFVASGQMGLKPSIHIWEVKTLKCITRFDKVQRNSISFLKFAWQGKLLITVGERNNSPITILNISTREVILSTWMEKPILNILFLQAYPQDIFIVLPESIAIMEAEDLSFQISHFKLSQNLEGKNIIYSSIVAYERKQKIICFDENNQPYLFNIKKRSLQKIQFHQNGENSIMESSEQDDNDNFGKKQNERKIIGVFPSRKRQFLYVLYQRQIQLWKMQSTNSLICVSKISQIPKNLYNLQFIHLVECTQNEVIVVSLMGDVIKIKNILPNNVGNDKNRNLSIMEQNNEQIFLSDRNLSQASQNVALAPKINKKIFKKYYQIFKMQKIDGICFFNYYQKQKFDDQRESCLLVASNSYIYVIDQLEKQLISFMNIEQKITHIHAHSNMFVVATQFRYLLIIRDGAVIEKIKCGQGDMLNAKINAIKMTQQNIVLAFGDNVDIYTKKNGEYFQKEPKRVKIQQGIPINIGLTASPKIFIIITREKLILKLNTEPRQKNPIISAKQLNCNHLELLYPQTKHSKTPFLFAGSQGMFLLGQPNGDIFFWNSLEQMQHQLNNYSILSGHSGPICDLLLSKTGGFVSACKEDGQIIFWKNMPAIVEVEDNEEQSQSNQNLTASKKINEKLMKTEEKICQNTDIYLEELKSCSDVKCDEWGLKDSLIMILTRNKETYKDVWKAINQIILPQNQQLYQPLIDGMNKGSNLPKNYQNSEKSNINLSFNFAYGLTCQKNRQSVFYIHKYPKSQIKQQSFQSSIKKTNHKKLQYATSLLLPLQETHQNCKRSFVYFTGRFGLTCVPGSKQQFHYDFHRRRISCAAVHPNRTIVCTAQISPDNPTIHIWDTQTMNSLSIIKTKHEKIISRIQFSRDGSCILTLGGMRRQSLQMHEWVSRESLAFRMLDCSSPIFDIKFNPYDSNQIAVGGAGCLWILKNTNRTFIKQEIALVPRNEDITCLAFTSSIYGNTIESDIIGGSSNGHLWLFICGKFIQVKQNAHQKGINCLTLCQLFKYKTVILTASEDNHVKLWDNKFNELCNINVRDLLLTQKTIHEIPKSSLAPQSVDVYHCFTKDSSQKGNLNKNATQQTDTMLLIGTRNGCLLEIKILNKYQGLAEANKKLKDSSDISNESSRNQNIQINHITQISHFPSALNKETKFDIKGNLMLTYTEQSQIFVLWNVETRELIKQQRLNSCPSVIRFSKGKNIVVGFYDGHIEIYCWQNGSFISRDIKIFYNPEFYPIEIVFSQGDSRMAVVFCRSNHEHRKTFSNMSGTQGGETFSYSSDHVLFVYEKVLERDGICFQSNEQGYSHKVPTERRKLKNVYWLDFSTNGTKLLICYTIYDINRLNSSNRRRIISALSQNYQQVNYEFVSYDVVRRMEQQKQLNGEQFSAINFSPVIFAKHKFFTQCTVNNNISSKQTEQSNQSSININIDGQSPQRSPSLTLPTYKEDQEIIEDKRTKKTIENVRIGNISSPIIKEQATLICQMAQFDKYTLFGTAYGEIFSLQSQMFFTPIKEQKDFMSEEIDKFSQGNFKNTKCFNCADSPITKMHVIGSKLFVSSKDCSSILQFQLKVEDNNIVLQSKLSHRAEQTESLNIFQQFNPEKMNKMMRISFPKRINFYQYKLNASQRKRRNQQKIKTNKNEDLKMSRKNEEKGCEFYRKQKQNGQYVNLQVQRIIGRSAYHKRNNIFIDLKDNIISYSGCNLLVMSPGKKRQNEMQQSDYVQQFLKLDNTVFSTNPQISALCLSTNKRVLYAGTSQLDCQIIVWDISTRTQLDHIYLRGYVHIQLIKVSESERVMAVLAVSSEGNKNLLYLSTEDIQIFACCSLDGRQQIHDIQFFPKEQFRFMACGNNYIGDWTYKGNLLVSERYSMQNPKDFIQLSQQTSKHHSVVFYSIIFIRDIAISAGSDGYLYLWSGKRMTKKQNAHPKSPILCLFASKNSKIFASGAVDGKAIIWELGSSSIIQKVFQFTIYDGKDLITPSKFHIQSVCIGKSQIYMGTRSGDIYKCNCTPGEDNTKQNKPDLILSAFDNDQINSCSFNISSQKLYVLTRSGVFCVFNLKTNKKVKEQKIKLDGTEIVKMLVCKLSNKIYLILKKSIEVYNYISESEEKGKQFGRQKAASNKFSKAKQHLKSTSSEIKAAILSLNQRHLALLLAPNQIENAKIEIYDLTQHEPTKDFYILSKVLQNIPANISVIDFSTDNGYLVYKSSDQDQTIIDLTTKQTINTNMIQFQLQWSEEAKKTSKFIRDICNTYTDQNKLQALVQIMGHSVVASDQMGSLRIFHYGLASENNAVDYYDVYLEHLNDVHLCILSSDCSTLVTVGRQDRSIIVWSIKNIDAIKKRCKNMGAIQNL